MWQMVGTYSIFERTQDALLSVYIYLPSVRDGLSTRALPLRFSPAPVPHTFSSYLYIAIWLELYHIVHYFITHMLLRLIRAPTKPTNHRSCYRPVASAYYVDKHTHHQIPLQISIPDGLWAAIPLNKKRHKKSKENEATTVRNTAWGGAKGRSRSTNISVFVVHVIIIFCYDTRVRYWTLYLIMCWTDRRIMTT